MKEQSNNEQMEHEFPIVSLCFLPFLKNVQQFLLLKLNAALLATQGSTSSAAKGRVEIGSDKMKQLLKETTG